MGRKKTMLMVLLVLLVLVSMVLGLLWHSNHYVLVDMQFYPKDARQLDLRDQEITVRHYEKLRRRVPGCEIIWNVPFQETRIPSDTREITVNSLTEKDIRRLEYFPYLETVHGDGCGDYADLLALRSQRPDLQVTYTIPFGEERYAAEAEQVHLSAVTPEQIALLQYLPKLQSVLCSGGSMEAVSQLQEYCQTRQLEFRISLGGEVIPLDTKTVTAGAVTEGELSLLQLFRDMKQLHIRQPKVSAQQLLQLQKDRPEVAITWEQALCGQVFSSEVEEIDLSGESVTDLEALARQMPYFPKAKVVFLGECGLDNEVLATHRASVRDQYKLVWTVSCGNKLKTRTDATTFMPVRENVFYFNDEEAYNLRYCEDMICIDIGHMSIHNIDFVEFMPNLQYLILAHTQLSYIEPISSCKNLKFLELDWSPLKDLTPLKGCTALEDLNLGNVHTDFAPIAEMTWLKNLWMIDCSTRARYEMTQALPDTKVMVTGAATVANGWRDLDNYYEMRDLLGMHYMSW